MQYISPYHLLGNDFSGTENAIQTIQRAKRRWLADLELSQDGNVSLNGLNYSKNDIIQFFEEIQLGQLPLHQQVYGHPELLAFLERGEIPAENWQNRLPPTVENRTVYAFIQPFFAHQYNQKLTEAIKAADHKLISQLVKIPLISPEADWGAYYSGTTRYLSSLHQQLQHLSRNFDGSAAHIVECEKFTQYPLVRALNTLPNYFQTYRDQIGNAMADLFLKLYNRPHCRTKLAESLLYNGLMLVASADVLNRLNIIRDKVMGASSSGSSSTSSQESGGGWPALRAILFGVFIVIKLLVIGNRGCSSSSRSQYSTYQPSTYGTTWPRTASDAGVSSESQPTNQDQVRIKQLMDTFAADSLDITGSTSGFRPKTGFRPYTKAFTPVHTIYRNAPVHVRNRSKFDAVLCLHFDNQPLENFYIRAGETLKIDYMPVTFLSQGFYAKWYCGKQWDENLAFDLNPSTPMVEEMREVSLSDNHAEGVTEEVANEVVTEGTGVVVAEETVEVNPAESSVTETIKGRFRQKAKVADSTPELHIPAKSVALPQEDDELRDVKIPVQEKAEVTMESIMVLGKTRRGTLPVTTFTLTSTKNQVVVTWNENF